MDQLQKLILVADDDSTLRMLTTKQLERLGYTGETAVSGLEAVKKEAVQSYDLILMDINMPEMDGLAATKAIRERERSTRNPRKPIIAMTANPDKDACLRAGMDDFLLKPVTLNRLEGLLRQWLTG
jgi:two-component system sensor histidine kinase/response regulator